MDWELLKSHVTNGLVRAQQHPTLPLTIYNYSQEVQYGKLWDDVTLQCRGLVTHGGEIVARPFRKFFNDTEHTEGEIPWHLESEVTEKMDGSLIIAFWFEGGWRLCTRGSFTSEQSELAREIYNQKYAHVHLDASLTYLFELIHPANRIVVDYGGRKDLVLLGMIETATGIERPMSEANVFLSHVRHLPPTVSAKELRSIIRDDEEGYVVRFANGFRMKVKGARYMELHKILCGISTRSVWECLSQGKSLADVLAVAPDEFGEWIRQEAARQNDEYSQLLARVDEAYGFAATLPSRKEQALFLKAKYQDVMGPVFSKLDAKPCEHYLWKAIYPNFQRPKIAELLTNA